MTALLLITKATIFLVMMVIPPSAEGSDLQRIRGSSDNVLLRGKRSTCKDTYSLCPAWKVQGYGCNSYNRNNCRRTCGLCRVSNVYTYSACRNKHTACPNFARSGYCKPKNKYSSWMRSNCAYSCGYCRQYCGDEHQSCGYWARNGECTRNPAYMLRRCKKSCGRCGVITTKKPTPKRTKPTPKSTTPKATKTCGMSSTVDARIVGGRFALPGAWPWHVAITSCRNCSKLPFCGGTLISGEWIVTAAHCVQNWLPSELFVVLGDTNFHRKGGHEITVGVESIFVHNDYAIAAPYDNDIALLRLKTAVVFSRHVKPACLVSPSVKLPAGTKCTVTGFGRTSEKGDKSPRLMQATVPLKSTADCKKLFGQSITRSMLCAGYSKGGIDSCRGDSGGPLVCKSTAGWWQLTGVVSWGKGCARQNHYGVYADVRVLRAWIEKTIAQDTSARSG